MPSFENPESINKKRKETEEQAKEKAKQSEDPDVEMIDILHEQASRIDEMIEDTEQYDKIFQEIPEKFKNDKEVVLEAVKRNGLLLFSAAEELQQDQEVISKAIKSDWRVYKDLPKERRADKEIALHAVKSYKEQYMNEEQSTLGRDNRFDYLSMPRELKDDEQFMRKVAEHDGNALSHFGLEEPIQDRELALQAVKDYGGAFGRNLSRELRDDEEILRSALDDDGYRDSSRPIYYASERLRNNRDIVMKAVTENGKALEHVPDKFKDDKEIVSKAIKETANAYEFASDRLKNDKDLFLLTAEKSPDETRHAAESIRSNPELLLKAVKDTYVEVLWNAEDEQFANKEFLQKAAEIDDKALYLAKRRAEHLENSGSLFDDDDNEEEEKMAQQIKQTIKEVKRELEI